MKQAVLLEPGALEFREVPEPAPASGEVLLRIRRIGVCGSDVHVWHGRHPYTSYPVVQGHEFSATVEAVGDGVAGLEPGMLVTALPQEVCGTCGPCRRGDWHICEQLRVRGFQAPGVAQELFLAPAGAIVPLGEAMTPEQGAMVEPVAVAVHAAGRAGAESGRNVVVLGAGPIGNLTAQVLRSRGARVLVTDLSAHRLAIARSCGVEQVSDAGGESLADAARRAFGDEGFDAAFECAAAEPAVNAAIENLTKGGTVVLVGVFAERPRVDLGLVQDRELTLIGTLMYQRGDYEEAIRAISSGKVALEPLMGPHYPLERYAEAYEFIDARGEEAMKVFVDVTP